MFGLFRKVRHPLEQQAMDAANIIQHQLARLNLAYRIKVDGREEIQLVEFVEPLIATPGEIRMEVDMSRLPRSVTIADLRKPEVLETLSVACKRPIRAEHKRGGRGGGGFWFVVALEEHGQLPKMVRWSQMQLPTNSPPLAIPIGMGKSTQQRWEDLRKLPHLLVAGATGQGKSVMVNALLCTLTRRWAPAILQLYLADLKGGMELSFYEKLPHVQQFVTKAQDLPAMLLALQAEMERRTELMRGRARDIDEFNRTQSELLRLPYVVAVIDEIANAMLAKATKIQIGASKRSIASATELLLADLAARARATGIHLIISTQRPSVDVVTGLIKANFPCRIAFGTASEVDSRVIVDDGAAHGLPVGRLRFRRNMELLELQAPFLSDSDVRKHVESVVRGEYQPDAPPESEAEITKRKLGLLLSVAESDFAGRFPVKDLARHPVVKAAKIGFTQVEELAKRLEHEGIVKARFGPRPRSIRVPPAHWRALYPVSVIAASSGTDPSLGGLEPVHT